MRVALWVDDPILGLKVLHNIVIAKSVQQVIDMQDKYKKDFWIVYQQNLQNGYWGTWSEISAATPTNYIGETKAL